MSRFLSSTALAVFTAVGVLAACGSDTTNPAAAPTGPDGSAPDAMGPDEPPADAGTDAAPKGMLANGPVGQWVWHDMPATMCGNGTPTGIAVNRGSGSQVILYLAGGSGCSNEDCTTSVKYVREGYDAADFQETLAGTGENKIPLDGLFNRTAGSNPWNDATFVYLPYCSGDFYVGNTVVEWPSWTAHYAGARNIDLSYAEVAASFPNASRVTLTGGSAGAFGALFTYWKLVKSFPNTRVDIVSDSYSIFENSVVPFFRDNKFDIWNPVWVHIQPGYDQAAIDAV